MRRSKQTFAIRYFVDGGYFFVTTALSMFFILFTLVFVDSAEVDALVELSCDELLRSLMELGL